MLTVFLFLRLKEQQIHIGRIDLIGANCHWAKRPVTFNHARDITTERF